MQKTQKVKKAPKKYTLQKNTGMKVLRIILWVMLVFIFLRGIVSIFRPNTKDEVTAMITDFKENYNQFTSQNSELMSFAQNFTKEYLTYTARGETEYKNRLMPYVSSGLLNSTNINDCAADAEATYVEAYKIEVYSECQADVYVLANMEYSNRILEDDGQTYTTQITKDQLILSVPIFYKNGAYIVEDVPLMVTDSVKMDDYAAEVYSGTSLSDAAQKEVSLSVDNFLKAYCEQDESVIDYYLGSKADKTKFTGLHGRFLYLGIDNIRCYQETGEDIVCLVEFRIQDEINGVKMLQKINLSISKSGGKFYINDMNTRTGNLNMSK